MSDQLEDNERPYWRALLPRIIAAIAAAGVIGILLYLLLEATRPESGLISFSFLLIVPTALCALAAYVADPKGTRETSFYLSIPFWVLLGIIGVSIVVLREGTICILILSPLWLALGSLGSMLVRWFRAKWQRDRSLCAAILLAPLLAMQLEPMIPLPEGSYIVSRSIIVDAAPERIWPLLRGIPDVKPGEGRWNISQDVIGVPRPLGARLLGEGIGAERLAHWQAGIGFRERITEWQPGRRIGWRFDFAGSKGWAFTDRHLRPDSAYFRITSGGYRVAPAGPGQVRVTLDTRYWIKTPVNAYSALWGELFLGDVENNLLALIKQRAERPIRRRTPPRRAHRAIPPWPLRRP